MHHRTLDPFQSLVGPLDQLLARLDQHLHGNVIGNLILLDQPAHKIVVGLAGGGETDLDLLESKLDQQRPKAPFLGHIHRFQ